VFPASDEKSLIIHLSSPPKFWEGLCTAVGRPELVDDPRFDKRSKRIERYEELRAELSPAFATKPRDEWLDVLQAHQVPCAPVNSIGEMLEDEQLRHLGIIDTIDVSGVGPMPDIRPPVQVDGQPVPAAERAPFL
jgi:crotonobetainyl-CoA:carnitine CoA-transferase CaiB-like acyl-CoA transferase